MAQNEESKVMIIRSEVKDLLMLLFSLSEYNLRLIFQKKSLTQQQPRNDSEIVS